MTLVHHYSSIQSSFIVLKILCALPIHPNLFLGFFQSFVKPSFSMGVVNSKPTTWWHQKLNFKFWLDPASRKAAFTVEETEAMFLSDPMIQGHKSTSLYMKTGRMVLFTQRGKKTSSVLPCWMFRRLWMFLIWSTFGVLAYACLTNQGKP